MYVRTSIAVFVLMALVSGSAFSEATGKPDPAKTYFQSVKDQAEKGDVSASICLGDLYEVGIGTDQSYAEALATYQAAADKGTSEGKLRVLEGELGRDPVAAVKALKEMAEGGYKPAATGVGDAYANGLGVSKDSGEALRWYKQAAGAGDLWAEARLGAIYEGGIGVKRDATQGKYWLDKAADHEFNCFGTFMMLSLEIIRSYYYTGVDLSKAHTTGALGIRFVYDKRHAKDVVLISSSGVPIFDEGMIQATQSATLPTWPESYPSDDKTMSFWLMKNPER